MKSICDTILLPVLSFFVFICNALGSDLPKIYYKGLEREISYFQEMTDPQPPSKPQKNPYESPIDYQKRLKEFQKKWDDNLKDITYTYNNCYVLNPAEFSYDSFLSVFQFKPFMEMNREIIDGEVENYVGFYSFGEMYVEANFPNEWYGTSSGTTSTHFYNYYQYLPQHDNFYYLTYNYLGPGSELVFPNYFSVNVYNPDYCDSVELASVYLANYSIAKQKKKRDHDFLYRIDGKTALNYFIFNIYSSDEKARLIGIKKDNLFWRINGDFNAKDLKYYISSIELIDTENSTTIFECSPRTVTYNSLENKFNNLLGKDLYLFCCKRDACNKYRLKLLLNGKVLKDSEETSWQWKLAKNYGSYWIFIEQKNREISQIHLSSNPLLMYSVYNRISYMCGNKSLGYECYIGYGGYASELYDLMN